MKESKKGLRIYLSEISAEDIIRDSRTKAKERHMCTLKEGLNDIPNDVVKLLQLLFNECGIPYTIREESVSSDIKLKLLTQTLKNMKLIDNASP
jgi:hypothetical protein